MEISNIFFCNIFNIFILVHGARAKTCEKKKTSQRNNGRKLVENHKTLTINQPTVKISDLKSCQVVAQRQNKLFYSGSYHRTTMRGLSVIACALPTVSSRFSPNFLSEQSCSYSRPRVSDLSLLQCFWRIPGWDVLSLDQRLTFLFLDSRIRRRFLQADPHHRRHLNILLD